VHRVCKAELGTNYELEVVDVYQQPERAREHQIIATPTLIKFQPQPVRRFIGNLANARGLFSAADMPERGRPL
jgi:circadian clock protein KaiB